MTNIYDKRFNLISQDWTVFHQLTVAEQQLVMQLSKREFSTSGGLFLPF